MFVLDNNLMWNTSKRHLFMPLHSISVWRETPFIVLSSAISRISIFFFLIYMIFRSLRMWLSFGRCSQIVRRSNPAIPFFKHVLWRDNPNSLLSACSNSLVFWLWRICAAAFMLVLLCILDEGLITYWLLRIYPFVIRLWYRAVEEQLLLRFVCLSTCWYVSHNCMISSVSLSI